MHVKIRLRDHSRGLAVGRSISWSNLLVTVQGHIFYGKRTCSTIISKHTIKRREGSHNWYNEFREVCECFLNRLLESSESVNVFFIAYLYEWNICFHRCWYEWNRWMFSLLFPCMNGLFESFRNHWFKWMESVNLVFIICWHEWNLWMCLLSVYVNWTFECFFYDFCLYEWNMWMFSLLFVYMNWISESVFLIVNLYE